MLTWEVILRFEIYVSQKQIIVHVFTSIIELLYSRKYLCAGNFREFPRIREILRSRNCLRPKEGVFRTSTFSKFAKFSYHEIFLLYSIMKKMFIDNEFVNRKMSSSHKHFVSTYHLDIYARHLSWHLPLLLSEGALLLWRQDQILDEPSSRIHTSCKHAAPSGYQASLASASTILPNH